MEGLKAWLNQLDFSFVYNILLTALACLTCITLHELAHGLIALAMGDKTAKEMGRLSLNPLKHMDVVGLAMLALAGFGWAKPVPVNPRRFKNPKWGMALCALAGPFCNILICFLGFVLLFALTLAGFTSQTGGLAGFVSNYLVLTVSLSAGMAAFNLLPVPPLDGSKVLFSVLPAKAYQFVLRYERYGMVLLLLLVVFGVLDGFLLSARVFLLESVQNLVFSIYLLFV